MPGVESGDILLLSVEQLGEGLPDTLLDLLLGDLHHTAKILVVVVSGDQHLYTGLEQAVDYVLVLEDDLVIPVLYLDFLSLRTCHIRL